MGHPVATAVTEIAAVLDGVSDASLWSMTDGQVASVTAAAGRLVARAQGLLVRLVGEVDARELGCRAGASTTAGWVRHELNVTVRQGRQIANVARATRTSMTATAQALAEGRVGLAHAAVIVDTVQGLPPGLEPALAARAETDLISHAARFDPEQLARLGAHILTVVAPEIGEVLEARRLAEQEQLAERRRTLTITADGHGLEWIRGSLDTESAAVLRAALGPLEAPRPTAADGPDLHTVAHRRGDVLVRRSTCWARRCAPYAAVWVDLSG